MKKIHLILCFSIMFFLLFYDESAGINLALLGAVYSIVIYALTPKFLRSERLKVMLIFSLVSCGAFAYYGYFISFFAIVISVFLLRLFSLSKELKPILTIPLAMWQGLSFPFRFFSWTNFIFSESRCLEISKTSTQKSMRRKNLSEIYWNVVLKFN